MGGDIRDFISSLILLSVLSSGAESSSDFGGLGSESYFDSLPRCSSDLSESGDLSDIFIDIPNPADCTSSEREPRTIQQTENEDCNTLSQNGEVSLVHIRPFNSEWISPPGAPESYNDDLILAHFSSIRSIWAGQKRAKAIYNIPGAQSHAGHSHKAMREPFHLSGRTPLPVEITEALNFPMANSDEVIRAEWADKLIRLEALSLELEPLQTIWKDATVPAIRQAVTGAKPVLISHLLAQLGIGGSRWLRQFARGFGAIGTSSHGGLFPAGKKFRTACGETSPWVDAADRFLARSGQAGSNRATELWEESIGQVEKGRLTPPNPLATSGGILFCDGRAVNAAFRFPVAQMDKVRACDDLKYGEVNPACDTRTPITLPNWGHIGRICLDVADSERKWPFFTADHSAAYKNLPLDPGQADACVVTLRLPTDGGRYGFFPRTLLFGETAAVLHYNGFSRIVAVFANIFFGLPVVSYFDDFGSLLPSSISDEGMAIFRSFCGLIGAKLKEEKRRWALRPPSSDWREASLARRMACVSESI